MTDLEAKYERRIAIKSQDAIDFDDAAKLITGTSPAHVSARKLLEHSAESCRADAAKHQALLDALREQEAA